MPTSPLGASALRRRLTRMFELRGADDALVRARLAVTFVHRFSPGEPDLILTLDGRGAAPEVSWHAPEASPDLVFDLAGEDADAFWSGEMNVMAALRGGKLKMRGNPLRAVALLPSQSASQAAYRAARDEETRGDAP